MAAEANRFKLGVFVVVGVIAAIVGVTILGAGQFFRSSDRAMTYFKESVQGLEGGASVKYRGVPIGRVTRIYIPWQTDLVAVEFEIFPDSFVADPKLEIPMPSWQRRAAIEQLVQEGYRVTLNLAGITGLRYLEIDKKDPIKHPIPKLSFKPPLPYIPSVPSQIQVIAKDIGDAVNHLAKVDFGGISTEVKKLLSEINTFVGDLNTHGVAKQFNAILAETNKIAQNLQRITGRVDKGMAKGEFVKVLEDVHAAVTSVKDIAAKINKRAGPITEETLAALKRISALGKQLDEKLAKLDVKKTSLLLNRALADSGDAARALASLRSDAQEAFRQLQGTLQAIRRFADFLDRYPNALITGRPGPK